MKKNLAIVSLILISGCSGDDDKPKSNTKDLSNIITINDIKNHEITLPASSLEVITSTTLDITSIESISKPSIVDLNNISISDNVLFNNTPYDIDTLILTNGADTKLVTLSSTLQKYSKGSINDVWNGYEISNQTPLSNSTFEYESSVVLTNHPTSVHTNEEQRETGEFVQIYDRFMINAPETLYEVTEHLKNICGDNSECNEYSESIKNYAIDTYYAKSVSGMNSRIWIDTEVWGLGSLTSLNFTSSTKGGNPNIWMHPTLIGNVHDSDVSKQKSSWQAFVHEYYHNHGLTHDSGWASSNGIDDIFGAKVVDTYKPNYGNKLILPNTIIKKAEKTGLLEYTVDVARIDQSDDITVRLLSTKDLSATITQAASSISVKFLETPQTDVYLSLYSDKALQMSSVVLNQFTLNINTASNIQSFNENISNWVSEYDVINVSIRDGVWTSEFNLPTSGVAQGKVINFNSTATYSSTIYHDGSGDILSTNNSISYRYDGQQWIQF